MSKHILLYSDDPGMGEVAQYNHSLLCGLAALGYRLTCVQSQSSNLMVSTRQQLGIEHLWLDFDTTSEPERTISDLSNAEKIFPLAQPDLIIFSDTSTFSNLGAKNSAVKKRIPFLVVIGLVDPFRAEGLSSLIINELSRFYRRAIAAIAFAQENLNLLHQKYGLPEDKGQVIYPGIAHQYFAPPAPSVRDRLRAELGIPQQAVVCFTCAPLEPVKGYNYQLAAMQRLKDTAVWDSLYFVWAGSGEIEQQLRFVLNQLQVSTEQVKILGQRWDIPDLLDASDIFILTSVVEAMPLSIMEAMAKGLPVIATCVSGVPEQLGDTGKLLPDPKIDPHATVNELVTTIQAWCAEPQLRHQIGVAGKTRAEQLFREERMIQQTHALIESAFNVVMENALKSNWDYVSPGFKLIRPDEHFPNMIVGDSWQYLNWEIPHRWYVDKRYPEVRFLNRDEAHILYNIALKFPSKKALEIGCWLGWSACHLALAGVELDVIDPVLEQPDFYDSVKSSLQAAGVLGSVNLVAGCSPQKVEKLAEQLDRKWSLIFIDGNHDAPGYLDDAMICEKYAEDDALILFHNLIPDVNTARLRVVRAARNPVSPRNRVSVPAYPSSIVPDVAQGLEYLRQQGWNVMIYQTMQIMGVAWRGNVEPVTHQPDPQVNWYLPKHLQHFPVSGISNQQSVKDHHTVRQVKEWQLKTPVCLIIFNRPDNTEKVFEAIREAKPPNLLVIADGPRVNRPEDAEKCAAARAVINRVDWECEVLTNFSDINLGCRKRVSSGLDWVFDQVEEAIILEDDCLPHPTFFRFCEELLERYRHNEQIMAISGDNFQFGRKRTEDSYYFSRYSHIWGWATWRRAWQKYDLEMSKWPEVRESNLLREILQDQDAAYYWFKIFQSSYDGFDTWDFAWTFACWIHNGLTILPEGNLVSNLGYGVEATHTTGVSKLANMITKEMSFPLHHPSFIIGNTQADDFTEKLMFSC